MDVVAVCGSCRRAIAPVRDAETCWFCGDDLCIGCWDARGHCGHSAADAINALSGKGPVLQDDIDRIMVEHGGGDCPVHGFQVGEARKRLAG